MIDKTITSASNSLFGDWRECLSAKGIRKHGLFLIAGEKAVVETIERFPKLARSLLLCEDRHVGPEVNRGPAAGPAAWNELVDIAREKTKANEPRFSVIALARDLFDELDVSGTQVPLLLARAPEIAEFDFSLEPQGLEVLCALQDPANVGALLRSAAAFGASKVILLKESASPLHPRAVRAASATTLRTPLFRGPSIRDLPARFEEGAAKGPLIALDMHGASLVGFNWPHSARLLVGEEGQGVPESKAFQFVSVPMRGGVESLNATVAVSIALYSYSTRS